MIDRPSRDHWVQKLVELSTDSSPMGTVIEWQLPGRSDRSLVTIIEEIQEVLLMQLPVSAASNHTVNYADEGPQREQTELCGSIPTSQIRPQEKLMSPGQKAIEVRRHTIDRAILFLRSDYELPMESWSVSNLWIPLGIGGGIACLVAAELSELRSLKQFGFGLLICTLGIIWLCYGLGQLLMGWHIFQVRILRRDLTAFAIATDANQCWPFNSHEDLAAARNKVAILNADVDRI